MASGDTTPLGGMGRCTANASQVVKSKDLDFSEVEPLPKRCTKTMMALTSTMTWVWTRTASRKITSFSHWEDAKPRTTVLCYSYLSALIQVLSRMTPFHRSRSLLTTARTASLLMFRCDGAGDLNSV